VPYRLTVTVQPSDIDSLRHANNLVYLRWVQEAAIAHSTACGLSEADYRARGQSFVVRKHEIEYLRAAFEGETLTVETHVATMTRVTSLRRTRILRDGELLARAATEWAYVDVSRGRAIRIPDDVRERFPLEPD
jgi:acyl-CoA thioester hydrolase